MYKTFIVIGENDEEIGERLEHAIAKFTDDNHCKEVYRSAPSVGMSPVGEYNGYYMISISVTCKFEEIYEEDLESAFK